MGEVAPPDGGWGWVVCFAYFMTHVLTDGIFYSFRIIFVELLDYYNEKKGNTALIASLAFGICLLSGNEMVEGKDVCSTSPSDVYGYEYEYYCDHPYTCCGSESCCYSPGYSHGGSVFNNYNTGSSGSSSSQSLHNSTTSENPALSTSAITGYVFFSIFGLVVLILVCVGICKGCSKEMTLTSQAVQPPPTTTVVEPAASVGEQFSRF